MKGGSERERERGGGGGDRRERGLKRVLSLIVCNNVHLRCYLGCFDI